jgi:hypothetical protein
LFGFFKPYALCSMFNTHRPRQGEVEWQVS